ncbi:MAG: substrate-binding domain-containing protein, partial [Planctomycetes bacterium]|nr:substrate-binding domain-containing protein [Planctomycetota bacterium]
MSIYRKIAMVAAVAGLALTSFCFAAERIIGYAGNDFNDIFQSYLLDAAETAARDNGARLQLADAREDAAAQQRQVEELVAAGAEALIIVAVDTRKIDPMVTVAKKAGVPIVFLNRNPYP